MKKIVGMMLMGALVFVLAACGTTKSTTTTEKRDLLATPEAKTEYLMGTVVTLTVYDKGKEKVVDQGFKRVRELADKITVNQKGSEVDKVNAQAGIAPVKVSDDVFYLIKEAYHYSQNSNEAFDLAIGPITQLWHIGFDDARKPAQSEIDAVMPLVNYQKVVLDEQNKTVFLKEKGMQLDLGGIAKGYITDEVVKVFKKAKVTTAIIDLGGNIYVIGHSPKKEGKKWTVGVQDPLKSRGISMGTIPESNQSIVTSGIYERKIEVDGVTYSHLMDPRTGYPFDNDIMGVTIVSDKSIDGDALSTATFAKGVKAGMKYIENKKDVEAVFITKDKKVYVSSGLKDFELVSGSKYKLDNIKNAK